MEDETDPPDEDAGRDGSDADCASEELVRDAPDEIAPSSRSATLSASEELDGDDETKPPARSQAQRVTSNSRHSAVHKTAARFTFHTSFQVWLGIFLGSSTSLLCHVLAFLRLKGPDRPLTAHLLSTCDDAARRCHDRAMPHCAQTVLHTQNGRMDLYQKRRDSPPKYKQAELTEWTKKPRHHVGAAWGG